MDARKTARDEQQRSDKEPLNKQRVVDSALAIVDRDGLDALNMRRLGSKLGVDPMAIYRHVDGRDGLLDGLAERLWSEVAVAVADAYWHDQLRTFARGLRQVFHAHPNAAPLMLQRSVVPVPLLEIVHSQLQSLRDAGFCDLRAGEIIRTVQSFSIGYGLAELTCFGVAQGEGAALSSEEMLVSIGQSLPPGAPPYLANAAIALYGDTNPDAAFESGLDLLLNGLTPG